jgi:hypothetical protein
MTGRTYEWPMCTTHRECLHVITHEDPGTANEFARAHMGEYVNRNGWAVCACHPASEAAALGVTVFPCDQSATRAVVAADPADTTAPPWAGPVEALRAGRVRRGLPARPDPDSSEAPA